VLQLQRTFSPTIVNETQSCTSDLAAFIDGDAVLGNFGFDLQSVSFDPVKDSSNIDPDTWIKIAETIEGNYKMFDGFVVLHGTDTMAYSASALSLRTGGQEELNRWPNTMASSSWQA
jgi:hypothetical protein